MSGEGSAAVEEASKAPCFEQSVEDDGCFWLLLFDGWWWVGVLALWEKFWKKREASGPLESSSFHGWLSGSSGECVDLACGLLTARHGLSYVSRTFVRENFKTEEGPMGE